MTSEVQTSLPACQTLHPTLPSEIEVSVVHKNNGTTYRRRICTTCRSVLAAAQPRNGRRLGDAGAPERTRYGVVRLDWAPPERVTR